MAYNVGTIEERFWQKVTKLSDDECWPWIANKNNKGYGMLYWIKYGRKILAHRVSHEIHNAPIDATMCVLHKCDNPPCCNPKHLFLGTMKDNHKDMVNKGRRVIAWSPENMPPHLPGFLNGNAKFTEEQVREIKESIKPTKFFTEKYDVARSTINRMRSGKSWGHL